MADSSIFPTMLVSSMARRKVTVMLSGDGGDEMFWGYPYRFAPIISRTEEFRQPLWLRTARRAAYRVTGQADGHAGLRWPTIGDWSRGMHSRLSDPALKTIFAEAPEWPDEFRLFEYDGWQRDRTAQWLRWNEVTGHMTRVLLKVDRASMYHSLEVRVPLLDREVLDTAARVDWQSCFDLAKGIGKLPLRQALLKYTGYQSTQKRGFSVPMAEWLRGPLYPVFQDVVLGRSDLLGLPFDRVVLAGQLDDHKNGRVDLSRWLWTVLNLALWDEHHMKRRVMAGDRTVAWN